MPGVPADGRPEIPAGGSFQPPPGPAGVVLDRRTPGAGTAGPAWSGRGEFHGTCSTFLARLFPEDQVPIAIRTPNVPFHPPALNSKPVVMICAGTGLAPFRGFLQERALRHAHGEPAGPALLFFGCDHPDVDLLYRDELENWERQGIVTLCPAFFRKPDGEVTFVQHRVARARKNPRAVSAGGDLLPVR